MLRNVTLSWTPAPGGGKQDVYFGTSFDAVSQATATADPGGVYQGRIDPNTYAVGLLTLGQTYYWRVDKVNADATVNKGTVWSFTVEPLAYRVTAHHRYRLQLRCRGRTAEYDQRLRAVQRSALHRQYGDVGQQPRPARSRPGSSTRSTRSTSSPRCGCGTTTSLFEAVLGFGFKDVTVEYSTDGTTWTVLKETQFARAPGLDDYAANTTVNFGGVPAKFVRLTAKNNWGGLVPQFGLSEVRFYYTPVNPRQPGPADRGDRRGREIRLLSWRRGREAGSHQVYFGTDANAVRQWHRGGQDRHRAAASTPARWSSARPTTGRWSRSTRPPLPRVGKGTSGASRRAESFVGGRFRELHGQAGQPDLSTPGSMAGPTAPARSSGLSDASRHHSPSTTIIHGGKQSMPLDYNNVEDAVLQRGRADLRQGPGLDGQRGRHADAVLPRQPGRPLSEAAGTITMSGGGTDIWNNADQFRFAFKPLTGDGTIVAKVESVDNTDPWAKGGVMIRESLDPGARFAAVYATPGNGVRYQARLLNAGAATSDTAVATPEQMALKTPVWIKVERKGSSFSCFYSTDGVKWTAMSWNPQTINMIAGTIYIGLAVTSHNTGAATTAVFSNVATTGNVTGSWQVQAIGVAQPANDAAPLYVVVQDSAGKSKTISASGPGGDDAGHLAAVADSAQ